MYWSIVQDCQGVDVVRYGKQRHGPQRYRCNNTDCPRHIFLLEYRNHAAFLR